jgi:hypothetical protein
VILRLILAILLVSAATVAPAFAQDADEDMKIEIVTSPQNSSCFVNDDKWGRLPIAGCTVKIRAPWSERANVYRYNKMRLRGPDYSPKPDSKTVRVLLLGPLFDSFNLSEDETAAHRLEERIQASGFKTIEVINGNIPGFYAPRTAEYAVGLIKAYRPDIVVYLQPADAASHDLLESRALRFQGDEIEKYVPVYHAVTAPPLLGWLWPDPETQAMIGSHYHQLLELWDIHKHSATSDEEAHKYMEPTIHAFQKIQKQLGPDQRLLVFYSAQNINNGFRTINAGGGGGAQSGGSLNSIFNKLAPSLFLPADLISQYLRTAGLHVYPMARGFRSPVQNELVYDQHPVSLTPQGAHAFAWGASYWIKPEIHSLSKGKNIQIAANRPDHRRHRGHSGKGKKDKAGD